MLALLLAATVRLVNAPDSVEPRHVDALWDFVQLMVGRTVDAPPVVYFPQDDEPPTTPMFLAFYYAETNVLRVGQPRTLTQAYEAIGHEMAHYAIENRDVSRHHQLMCQRGYWGQVAAWLVGAQIVSRPTYPLTTDPVCK